MNPNAIIKFLPTPHDPWVMWISLPWACELEFINLATGQHPKFNQFAKKDGLL